MNLYEKITLTGLVIMFISATVGNYASTDKVKNIAGSITVVCLINLIVAILIKVWGV